VIAPDPGSDLPTLTALGVLIVAFLITTNGSIKLAASLDRKFVRDRTRQKLFLLEASAPVFCRLAHVSYKSGKVWPVRSARRFDSVARPLRRPSLAYPIGGSNHDSGKLPTADSPTLLWAASIWFTSLVALGDNDPPQTDRWMMSRWFCNSSIISRG
jgi:hypothetical protein